MLLALSALVLSACGGDSEAEEQAAVDEQIATERAEAVADVRQRMRVREVEKELKELKEGEDALSDGDGAPPPVEAPAEVAGLSYSDYTSPAGGWAASVPTGGGWSSGVETDVNSGLHRTTFTGPGGAVLIIDSTPNEAPSYSGDVARTPVSHPVFGAAERLVFRGNTTVSPCETASCVDYLIPAGAGGFAVLAGGPGDFGQLASIAETVFSTLR